MYCKEAILSIVSCKSSLRVLLRKSGWLCPNQSLRARRAGASFKFKVQGSDAASSRCKASVPDGPSGSDGGGVILATANAISFFLFG